MNFTDDQRRAINHSDGNLQLIACAGSGKTEVVAQRVLQLLTPGEKFSVSPRNIVAFTFTDKAAAELKERIFQRCRETLGDLVGLSEMYVGTIHGFCLDLLKTEVLKYLKFEVLSDVQQVLFVDRNSTKSGLTACKDLQGNLLRRYVDTRNYIDALSILRESSLNRPALEGCSIVSGVASYSHLLDDKSYFDYSSILDCAAKALRHDAKLRSRLADRIKHVIVDEYQDVNPIQEHVVRELHSLGAALCVVGDDDQVLYQWRGSEVQNILSFKERYAPATQIKLEENFRSNEGIVETSRLFIEQNAERLPKHMKPVGGQEYEPGDLVALSFDDPEQEAAYIVKTCRSLLGVAIKEAEGARRGIAWSDMAILLRSVSKNAEPITRALRAAGIPYLVVGMNDLFATPEANAARDLFYFMAGRLDEKSVLESWKVADTGATLSSLKKAIASAKQSRKDMVAGEERHAVYSPQRVFRDFLENANVREETVPGEGGRGEILFYNLGKFSQLISDFEAIHFLSAPKEKYETFASFLEHRAAGSYPEGWQANQYANPNAVRIMTVHQAKGMQWPAVFVPALLKNRFPSKKQGGRNVWHLIPKSAVEGQARFEGSLEDERRLFYVAMTRAQKFLHMTWAPIPGNRLYQLKSEFWDNVLASKYVKRQQQDYSMRKRLQATPKAGIANVTLTFSDMKYFFECPYQFKLRILYGFNASIDEALGYGKSLHDALADVHARVIRGEQVSESDVPSLIDTHLRAPFAYKALREKLEAAATKVLTDYISDNKHDFGNIEYSEKLIEVNMGDGVSVVGRIDLVRRKDTDETSIVDLKSTKRAQQEDVTETQLHIYALGYKELTGRNADYVETYNLDERKRNPRSVDEDFLQSVKARVTQAASVLRGGTLLPTPTAKKCGTCDYFKMCGSAKK
ncbi:superfamily I DNA/RNA helicase [Caballeronia terrestris]|uniref:DNA 3'-5' helicase n=1 Tax=Caballeronia terrestris TaxID=1226301 RepID=A0A158KBY0_9BURK|nr:ATP-dependent DNA helicase [Caballeronia terrestris]SAL78597.1 superfamily I DNA/RNA helicase [Caballeronia terrestris]